MLHQYIERKTGEIITENLYHNSIINYIYSNIRENSKWMFNALVSSRTSSLLAYINYDFPFGSFLSGGQKFIKQVGVNIEECVNPSALTSARKVFERQIKYDQYRPMSNDEEIVVSPADSRCIVGSFSNRNLVFLKNKFFCLKELLGKDKGEWISKFHNGDFAIFRLTPDKYHHNHAPVSGIVIDFYCIDGAFHSCNPNATIIEASHCSKNRRVVTIIDTDVPGGTNAGVVAMIEVVALMIGDIVQCYSEFEYSNPKPVTIGLFLKRGQVKSLYRPGSSVDILIFEKNRIRFDTDLIKNQSSPYAISRFSDAFGNPCVETDLDVRSSIATAITAKNKARKKRSL
ncbi:MAG: phosphatidylserine decarboxylase [Spirochaetes bacterium]|nr:phosphatidylserine decarboxylase [Spirochaetota bacterium]MBN2769915.1 phosphatidylserine decarboxylase [Spirochaetota bacterium]